MPRWTRAAALAIGLLAAGLGAEPAVAGRSPKQAEVAFRNGRAMIVLDREPLYPMIYALTQGGRHTWQDVPHRNLENFARAGFRLYQIDVWFADVWLPDGRLDLETPARQIRGVLDVCPTAAVFIRLHVDAPPWWTQKFPAERTGYADGPTMAGPGGDDVGRARRQSMASTKWRSEATAKLIEFCRRLSAMPEGDAVVGLHLAGGVYGEWHYWGFSHQPDTGPAMTAYFRRWLAEKYRGDVALRAAWNDPQATLAAASVPGLDERLKTDDGVFRDPRRQRKVIDYYQCQQELVADDVIHFCRTAKEQWPRHLITGVFYGYFFHMFDMFAPGGHIETGRVLGSPYVDYLSGPLSYEMSARQVGGTGQPRGLLKSCALHGKLWLDEVDHPTMLGDAFGRPPPFRPLTLPDTIATMRRNAAGSFVQGMGMWWYDFGPKGHGGWWDHPALMAEVKRLMDLFQSRSGRPYRSDADVLLVYDPACFYYLGGPNVDPVTDALINGVSADVGHSGVMADAVYLADLPRADLRPYRVVVLANCLLLTEKQRQFIAGKVAADGRHLVWLYAPGYCDGRRLDIGQVSQVTGIGLRKIELPGAPRITVSREGFPATEFGLDRPLRPLFAVDDRDAVAVGRFTAGGQVALAEKKLTHSTAWFCALPLRNPALLRAIFRQAGAHVFDDQDDVIQSGGGVLCIQTEQGGRRRIVLRNGKAVETTLPPRSTTLYDNATGELLLGN